MNVTINALELASELANDELVRTYTDKIVIFNDDDMGNYYTDEAQDIFNDLYGNYIEMILSCKEDA